MKVVVALIRPEQLPAVKQALFEADMKDMAAATVMGTAPKAEQLMYRGVRHEVSLFRRVRLELVVQDSDMERAIDAICRGANDTGGHGLVFVTEVQEVVKVWSGERGTRAI